MFMEFPFHLKFYFILNLKKVNMEKLAKIYLVFKYTLSGRICKWITGKEINSESIQRNKEKKAIP